MELAKLSQKNQITIPVDIREKLKLKAGGKDSLVLEIDVPDIVNMTDFLEKY